MLAQCGDDRCEWQWHNAATTAPPAKKQKVSLFGRYKVTATQSGSSLEKTPAQVLASYTDMISVTDMQLTDIFKNEQFGCIRLLLERALCVPGPRMSEMEKDQLTIALRHAVMHWKTAIQKTSQTLLSFRLRVHFQKLRVNVNEAQVHCAAYRMACVKVNNHGQISKLVTQF